MEDVVGQLQATTYYYVVILLRFVEIVKNTGSYAPMQNNENWDIEQANLKVKERMLLEKLRLVPKYRDLSDEDYQHLIKNAEIIALLILKALFLKK